MKPQPTVIFDFINKAVVTPGATPDAAKRVQDFVAQQAQSAAGSGAKPQ